jgi:hypothetical protein
VQNKNTSFGFFATKKEIKRKPKPTFDKNLENEAFFLKAFFFFTIKLYFLTQSQIGS